MRLKDLNKKLDIKYDKLADSKFISFSLLKSAINENDFTKMNELYHLLLGIDLNIAGKLEQRKNALLENDFKVISEDEKFLKFYDKLKESFDFEDFIENLTNAVYFGIDIQNLTYVLKDGYILPENTKNIPNIYIQKDETLKKLYIEDTNRNKIYLDDTDDLFITNFFYNFDKDSFLNNSLSAKLLYYSVLKHSVITLNLEYLDKNAIPAVIIKSDKLDDENLAKELLTQIQLLKSNSIGIFDKEVEITTLKQDTESKFLELINYCDKKQNELILGGNLISSNEKTGTQSLGIVHQNRLKEIIKADAKKISKFVTNYLLKLCELNFSYSPVFDFIIEVIDEEDATVLKTKAETLKIKADTITSLVNLGYEIPLEHVEKEFDIKGLKFKQKVKEDNKLELNSQETLALDDIDLLIDRNIKKEKENDKELLKIIDDLLKDCNSYDEAYEKLLKDFPNIKLESLEKTLINHIQNAYMLESLKDD